MCALYDGRANAPMLHWIRVSTSFSSLDLRMSFLNFPPVGGVVMLVQETSEQLVHLLRKPPLNLPRPALQIVKSFIFSRDLSELMRETLVVLNLTDGMHIRS